MRGSLLLEYAPCVTHRGMMTERRTPILFVRMTVECPYYGLHSCEAGSRDWGGGGGCTTHNVAKAVQVTVEQEQDRGCRQQLQYKVR